MIEPTTELGTCSSRCSATRATSVSNTPRPHPGAARPSSAGRGAPARADPAGRDLRRPVMGRPTPRRAGRGDGGTCRPDGLDARPPGRTKVYRHPHAEPRRHHDRQWPPRQEPLTATGPGRIRRPGRPVDPPDGANTPGGPDRYDTPQAPLLSCGRHAPSPHPPPPPPGPTRTPRSRRSSTSRTTARTPATATDRIRATTVGAERGSRTRRRRPDPTCWSTPDEHQSDGRRPRYQWGTRPLCPDDGRGTPDRRPAAPLLRGAVERPSDAQRHCPVGAQWHRSGFSGDPSASF